MSIRNEPVELQIGLEVYIGSPPAPGKTKAIWIVKEIDERGNAKLHHMQKSHVHRNFPNVNILAGKLWRIDGRQIRGKTIPREPLTRSNRSGHKRSNYRSGLSF